MYDIRTTPEANFDLNAEATPFEPGTSSFEELFAESNAWLNDDTYFDTLIDTTLDLNSPMYSDEFKQQHDWIFPTMQVDPAGLKQPVPRKRTIQSRTDVLCRPKRPVKRIRLKKELLETVVEEREPLEEPIVEKRSYADVVKQM